MTTGSADKTSTADRVRAATMPALLIMLAIVVGLAAFSYGTSLGQGDTTAFDADIRNVQSILDSYHQGEPFDDDGRRVQEILDARSADR